MTYANGLAVKYVYDSLDRVKAVQYNIGEGSSFRTMYEYTYTSDGRLHEIIDYKDGTRTVYAYDATGQAQTAYAVDTATNTIPIRDEYFYDELSRMTGRQRFLDVGVTESSYTRYSYTNRNQLASITQSSDNVSMSVQYGYDAFERITSRSSKFTSPGAKQFRYAQSYAYHATTGVLSSYTSSTQFIENGQSTADASSTTYTYSYDANGNISQIVYDGKVQYQYYYDGLGRLVRENNRPMNKTYFYTYDDAGNILSRRERAFVIGNTEVSGGTTYSYTYGNTNWGDQLTGYSYYTLSYDALGNVTMVRDPMDYMSDPTRYGWDGRFLTAYGYGSGDTFTTIANYYYNADGIRTGKKVNGVMHEYTLNGTQIVAETWGEHTLIYLYDDGTGEPIGLKYRTTSYAAGVYDCYFFEKNIFGDVVAIYDENGVKIGSYAYNPWGISGGIAYEEFLNYAIGVPLRHILAPDTWFLNELLPAV